jgi:hypothetical protein
MEMALLPAAYPALEALLRTEDDAKVKTRLGHTFVSEIETPNVSVNLV